MGKKLTIDIVKENIFKKYNGKIEILSSEYVNNKSKLLVKCNDCGHTRYICYNKLSIDSCCPWCSKKAKKTTEIYKEEVKKMYNDEYEVIGEYKNVSTKIKMYHKACGKYFFMSPSNFLNGHKCPNCSHGSIRYSLEEYKKLFEQKNNGFIIKDIYVDNTKVCIRTGVDLTNVTAYVIVEYTKTTD